MATNTGDKLSPGNIVKQVYDNVNEAIKITGTVSTTVNTTGLATDTGQTTGNNTLASINSKITTVNTNSVTVTSTVLPTGAATSANQTTSNASLASIDSKVTPLSTITNTNNSGKVSLDVNVTDITLNANGDSVETRNMPEAVKIDFASSTAFIYKAFAPVNTAVTASGWKICKISLADADAGTTTWANGSAAYSFIWNNRATYTYS